MQNFLSHIEKEFYDLTGVLPEGIIGLFGGLLLFSLIIYLIRFEKKKEIILSDLDVSNDIGEEINAKINLSRSLIEMEQIDEARRLLEEVLKENLNSIDQSVANDLLESIK